MSEWIRVKALLPVAGLVVETKIDDGNGARNEAKLKRVQRTPESRSLWFLPDDSMYVYYEPTHWKPVI